MRWHFDLVLLLGCLACRKIVARHISHHKDGLARLLPGDGGWGRNRMLKGGVDIEAGGAAVLERGV